MIKKLIAGNWKMHMSLAEARTWLDDVVQGLSNGRCSGSSVDLAVFPPATLLFAVNEAVADVQVPVAVGAQNLHFEPFGAFTGEISAAMVRDSGCSMVLVGHSERRQVFREPDEWMGPKIAAALDAGLTPIYCVGESLTERKNGGAKARVEAQLKRGILDQKLDAKRIIIAYEPVWAIGTGVNATPEQAQEMHEFIRERLSDLLGQEGVGLPILYGGSAKPSNANALLIQPDVDGLLVGGASLEAKSFLAIAEAAG